MTRHTSSSSQTSARQFIRRYARWFVLGTLLVLAALTAYHLTPAPASATPGASSTQASAQDPAMQGVFAYLRAHSGETAAPTPDAPLDPAQQGVMQYLRAHERLDQPATLWDQVKQTVLGYLRGYGK